MSSPRRERHAPIFLQTLSVQFSSVQLFKSGRIRGDFKPDPTLQGSECQKTPREFCWKTSPSTFWSLLKKLRFSMTLNPTHICRNRKQPKSDPEAIPKQSQSWRRMFPGDRFKAFLSQAQKVSPGGFQRTVLKHFWPQPGKWAQETSRELFWSISSPSPESGHRRFPEYRFEAFLAPAASSHLEFVEQASVFRDSKPDTLFVAAGSNKKAIPKRSQSNPRVFRV